MVATAKRRNGKATDDAAEERQMILTVTQPNFQEVAFTIEGTSPYCQNRFGSKAMQEMHDQQAKGSAAKAKKKRDPKDFDQLYQDAKHISTSGWCGIPCSGLRSAMISACRCAGVVMTQAKLAVFVEPDGWDAMNFDGLVRITKGEPKYFEAPVRNASGVIDLRARPVWDPGWQAVVRLRFDAGMIGASDVANLLYRVGQQVGIGEGRHDSRKSCGLGWGCFKILMEE